MSTIKPHHFRQFIKNCKGFDKVLTNLIFLEAENGGCSAELKIDENHINPLGTLHGGLSATLVDVVSSLGLTTHNAAEYGHVSIDMHLTYYKSASIGEEIHIVSNLAKIGKKLAFLEVDIKNKESQEVLVRGTHVKFLLGG
ncbi:unnamed protein product [Ceutorhynchus assimilis]|uniref:Acyl-coenzyme A thioesterase 13 n=1 Tax=Ceutorhynchus assimilis TaxID=467358 RepID=A0A9N9MP93_9CUCU|nr:unnamed protein product [Ceutorhynchus assimilis]